MSASWQDTLAFYSQMRPLLDSSLSLSQALQLAAPRHGPYHNWAQTWSAATAAGEAWHQAQEASGERPLICALIAAGERSGQLSSMCREIIAIYEQAVHIKRMLLARLVYPTFLLHTALLMPILVAVIQGNASAWLLILVPGLLWMLIFLLVLAYRLGGRRGWLSRLALLPGCARLTQYLVSAQASLVIGAGLRAGMLSHQAVELAAASCANAVYAERLTQAAEQLLQESTLSQALSLVGLPREVEHMIIQAECSGSLEQGLQQAYSICSEQFRFRLTWTARIATGIIVGAVMLYAVIVIIGMFSRLYIAPLQEALDAF